MTVDFCDHLYRSLLVDTVLINSDYPGPLVYLDAVRIFLLGADYKRVNRARLRVTCGPSVDFLELFTINSIFVNWLRPDERHRHVLVAVKNFHVET